MSLTGPLGGVPAAVVRRIHDAADEAIAALADTPMRLDAIGVYEEPTPGAPFRLVHRSALDACSGRLIYIVGPSGVGKDSLIDYARRQLSDAHPIRFSRRTITRPARAGNERHTGVTNAQFALLEAEQAFSMVWHANGHAYGIGHEISQWLAAGDTVVVNGSRAYAVTAAAEFAQMELVVVGARPDTIRRRLRARARDDSAAIDARLARGGDEWDTPPCVVHRIDNDEGIDKAGEKLLALLLSPGAGAADDPC